MRAGAVGTSGSTGRMGLKFNPKKVPPRLRVLIGLQLGITGLLLVYRARVVGAKQEHARVDDA